MMGLGSQAIATVPRGAACAVVTNAKPTRSFHFALLPGFTLLAFSSAVEPLRIANQLSQLPLYRWTVVSEAGGPVESSSGIVVETAAIAKDLDDAESLLVCGGIQPGARNAPRIAAAVTRHLRHGGTVGGVCTGAFLLAKAGLLGQRRFTLHWENQAGFAERFPDLSPTGARFEIDGPVMTCGGGAAATDMMLAIIAQDYGTEFAATVSDMCLRSATTAGSDGQRGSLSARMAMRKPVLVEIIRLMAANLEDPMSMDQLAARAGYSRRHLERMFDSAFGEAPGQYYLGLRLDHARKLLCDTEMTLMQISQATGFTSVAHFSRCFKKRFGRSPSKLMGYASTLPPVALATLAAARDTGV